MEAFKFHFDFYIRIPKIESDLTIGAESVHVRMMKIRKQMNLKKHFGNEKIYEIGKAFGNEKTVGP